MAAVSLLYSSLMIFKPYSRSFDILSNCKVQPSDFLTAQNNVSVTMKNYLKVIVKVVLAIIRPITATALWNSFICFTCWTNTDVTTFYVSEEDKNEKEATADSVQQRRQYRRQNRQSSSGYKTFFFLLYFNLSCHRQFLTQPLFNQTFVMSPPLFLSRPLSSPCCLTSELAGKALVPSDCYLMVVCIPS